MRVEKLGKGFIFTLDAFISLTVILFGIFTLLLLLNASKTFYPSFEQTFYLAKDGLQAMDSFKIRDAPSSLAFSIASASDLKELDSTPLQEIATLSSRGSDTDLELAGSIGDEFLNDVIPPQYCYQFSFFDLTLNKWVYANSTRVDSPSTSKRCASSRLKASVSKTVDGFKIYDDAGGSPFEYGSCNGGKYPCGRERSLYTTGEKYGPTLVRLEVWI
ncbi:hypothetical protein HY992_00520 [Candidatus Micrarchaeota archaeon]|nr:hypothetical protein [Candidatus Micrarchaeota archaeon]